MSFPPEENLLCPICQDIFKDPVVLLCSHSFCKDCVNSWWKEKTSRECPVCKRRSSRLEPPCNLALKNLCESFSQRRPGISDEDLCKLHSEKHKLFCLNHQEPVCLVCRDSTVHNNHRFKPIDEASKHLKESLQKSLQPLKEKLTLVEEFKENCFLTLAYIKNQTRHTERQIRDQFKKLHKFLLEEEEAQMKALREEEEQKTQRTKDKMAAANREIEALSETIAATEEQLRTADVSFLLKYKAAVERVQHCRLLEEPQLDPGTLIDQAKHLGNLAFNIWSNMKKLVQYTPVVLDPNTAHPELTLSDDLTSFTPGETQRLPQNPERIKTYSPLVRGSEGFNSGSHSWDVEVGDSTLWTLGLMTESACLDDKNELIDEDAGCWTIGFSDGEYTAAKVDKKKDSVLKVKSNPRRIRVHLECDKHKLTFYDADTNTRLHSFSHIPQNKLFPVFGSKDLTVIMPQII